MIWTSMQSNSVWPYSLVSYNFLSFYRVHSFVQSVLLNHNVTIVELLNKPENFKLIMEVSWLQ